MAIIYTYPVKVSPVDDDLVLISDSADKNNTKQVKISSMRGATVSGVADVNISAVTSTLSTGAPLVSLPNSGNVIITSRAYDGGSNVGHVPTGGSATTFLRGDGSWIVPTNTTYEIMSSDNNYAAGLVLAGDSDHSNNFLRKDGSWAIPVDTGISFFGSTASGILTRGGTTVADVSSTIKASGSQMTFDGASGNTGVAYDSSSTTLNVGGIGGGIDTVSIYSAGVETVTIASTNVRFKNSSTTLFDNGIKLGSTGSTLSNYEFGTWTPTVYAPGIVSWSGTASTGHYEVIGDMVRAYFKISTTSYPADYPMNINNLPITASITAAHLGGVQVYTNTSSAQIGRATTGIITAANIVQFKTLQTSGNVNELIDSKYQPTGTTGTLEGLITYKKA